MAKEAKEPVEAAEAAAPLAPATYTVVGLDGQDEVYIPLLSKSYRIQELTPGTLELLHRLGWPHVDKK